MTILPLFLGLSCFRYYFFVPTHTMKKHANATVLIRKGIFFDQRIGVGPSLNKDNTFRI